jgi:transcription initiation factor TFIIIB Brf1 subunit/transcription initiation factor TFIIB
LRGWTNRRRRKRCDYRLLCPPPLDRDRGDVMTELPPNPVVCDACGNVVVPVPIVYGYPTPETFAAAQAGELVLGGCVSDDTSAQLACALCENVIATRADDDDEEVGAFLSYQLMDDDGLF